MNNDEEQKVFFIKRLLNQVKFKTVENATRDNIIIEIKKMIKDEVDRNDNT